MSVHIPPPLLKGPLVAGLSCVRMWARGCWRLPDLSAVGTNRPGGARDSSDLVEHAVETAETTGRADDRGRGVDDGIGAIGAGEIERYGAADAVHRPGEGLDVVEVGAPVGMDDQRPLQGRCAAERAGVGNRRAEIDDQVAPVDPDAVEAGRRIREGAARR